MPFLTLNGITVPVVEGRRRQVNIGTDSRAFGGAYRLGRRAVRQEWEFRTGPLTTADALAFRRFISGDGHALSFDADNYTSRGLGQASGSGTLYSGAKFNGGIRFTSVGSGTWATQLGSTWTTLHHRYDATVAGWRHFINRSDGSRFTQGISSNLQGGLSVSGGSLTLAGSTSLTDFDDAVALPFLMPNAWIADGYAWHAARAWSALPFLTAGGTFSSAEVRVLGDVKDGEFVEFVQNGARVVGERFDFILREV